MTLKDLKTKIEYKRPIEELIILKCSGSDFVAHQYIQKISEYTDFDVKQLESISDFIKNSSFFVDENIYLYKCEKLEVHSDRFLKAKNLIIVCKSVDAQTTKIYKNYIVDIPKLEDWQIKDYLAFNCPTVFNEFEPYVGKMDIYALDNEMNKVALFSIKKPEVDTATFDQKELPKYIIKAINSDNAWNYLPKYTIFDFVQALILKNVDKVNDILNMEMEISQAALCQILYTQLKDIINIVINKSASAESLKIPIGKFWAIKNTYSTVSKDRITNLFKFIVDVDRKVKTGEMSYDSDLLLDMILITFLGE